MQYSNWPEHGGWGIHSQRHVVHSIIIKPSGSRVGHVTNWFVVSLMMELLLCRKSPLYMNIGLDRSVPVTVWFVGTLHGFLGHGR